MLCMSTLFCLPEFREGFGWGHLGRQCTLIRILSKVGRDVYLTLPDHLFKDSHLVRRISNRVDSQYLLSYSDARSLRADPNFRNKVMIDSYDYQYIANHFGGWVEEDQLIVMDDLAYHKTYPSNTNVIVPNICSLHQIQMMKETTGILSTHIYGHQYILIDPEFLLTTDTKRILRKTRENRLNACLEGRHSLVLIIGFGGAEFVPDQHIESNFSKLWEQIQSQCYEVEVRCIGDSAASFCVRMGIRALNYQWLDTAELRKAYLQADVYFGSIGYSMWERAALLLPSFVVPIAENQIPYAIVGEELGVHRDNSYGDKIDWLRNSIEMLDSALDLEISNAGYFSI